MAMIYLIICMTYLPMPIPIPMGLNLWLKQKPRKTFLEKLPTLARWWLKRLLKENKSANGKKEFTLKSLADWKNIFPAGISEWVTSYGVGAGSGGTYSQGNHSCSSNGTLGEENWVSLETLREDCRSLVDPNLRGWLDL